MLTILQIDFGHFHPLLVHLPIGMLYLVGLLYGYGSWKKTKTYWPAIKIGLTIAFLSSILAGISGWVLSYGGGYAEESVSLHMWLGIATSAATLVLMTLGKLFNRPSKFFGAILIITLILLTLTGHFGGSMTHGDDYLFSLSENRRDLADLDQALVYEEIIAPILNEKCESCHSASKKKGGLSLASMHGIRWGGDSQDQLLDIQFGEGGLVRRLLLPDSDEAHMPPSGKTQLSEEEIEIIRWWVKNATPDQSLHPDAAWNDVTTSSLSGYSEIKPVLERHFSVSDLKAIDAEELAALRNSGVDVSWVSESDPMLGLSLENKSQISSDAVDALEDVAENVAYLSLAGSTLSSSMVNSIEEMVNLRQLMVQNSSWSDDQAGALSNLKKLEILNLYGTAVSDESVESLAELTSLLRLYTWNSGLSEEGLARLQDGNQSIEIISSVAQDIFPASQLKKPEIILGSKLFLESTEVELVSHMQNSVVHFTTDGSIPSQESPIYSEPFTASSSLTISALSVKEGWLTSEVITMQLIRATVEIESVKLSARPDPKYPGNGAESLIDLRQGEPSFGDENWLGWQGKNVTASLEMKESGLVSAVYVSCLSSPGSWIHFPKAVKVLISANGRSYASAGSIEISTEQRIGAETKSFRIVLDEPREAKYVKVKVESIGRNPAWHPSAGEKAWLFVDEIVVE
jgi:uncharacterized membrane protein